MVAEVGLEVEAVTAVISFTHTSHACMAQEPGGELCSPFLHPWKGSQLVTDLDPAAELLVGGSSLQESGQVFGPVVLQRHLLHVFLQVFGEEPFLDHLPSIPCSFDSAAAALMSVLILSGRERLRLAVRSVAIGPDPPFLRVQDELLSRVYGVPVLQVGRVFYSLKRIIHALSVATVTGLALMVAPLRVGSGIRWAGPPVCPCVTRAGEMLRSVLLIPPMIPLEAPAVAPGGFLGGTSVVAWDSPVAKLTSLIERMPVMIYLEAPVFEPGDLLARTFKRAGVVPLL